MSDIKVCKIYIVKFVISPNIIYTNIFKIFCKILRDIVGSIKTIGQESPTKCNDDMWLKYKFLSKILNHKLGCWTKR